MCQEFGKENEFFVEFVGRLLLRQEQCISFVKIELCRLRSRCDHSRGQRLKWSLSPEFSKELPSYYCIKLAMLRYRSSRFIFWRFKLYPLLPWWKFFSNSFSEFIIHFALFRERQTFLWIKKSCTDRKKSYFLSIYLKVYEDLWKFVWKTLNPFWKPRNFSEKLKLILNFLNEYSKIGMKDQRFSTKFSRLAIYEKISVFQQIIRIRITLIKKNPLPE